MSPPAIPRVPGSGTALPSAQQDATLRTQVKGTFVRAEVEIVDWLRLAFFEELQILLEEEPELKPEQILPDFLPDGCPIMWTRVLRSRKVT